MRLSPLLRTFLTCAAIGIGLLSLWYIDTPESAMITALLGTFLGGVILTISRLNRTARGPAASLSRVVHETGGIMPATVKVRPAADRRIR
jgi:hypothetical protein